MFCLDFPWPKLSEGRIFKNPTLLSFRFQFFCSERPGQMAVGYDLAGHYETCHAYCADKKHC